MLELEDLSAVPEDLRRQSESGSLPVSLKALQASLIRPSIADQPRLGGRLDTTAAVLPRGPHHSSSSSKSQVFRGLVANNFVLMLIVLGFFGSSPAQDQHWH